MDPNLLIKTVFLLGVQIADHVNGVRRMPGDPAIDAIFDTLNAVADGTLTLMDTPEEMLARIPPPPPEIARMVEERFREMIRIGRGNQQIAARIVVATRLGEQ